MRIGERTIHERFSKAGYFEAEGSPRRVTPFNAGWRFWRGMKGKDDEAVQTSLPHSIDKPMFEASGGVNRQELVTYSRRFDWHRTKARAFLHFEGVMGKSRFFVNGSLAAEHFGGFLPVHFEVGGLLRDGENEVTVTCDNSDDPSYPPGKPQGALDFCYFGGIYRDCWLVETEGATVEEPSHGGVRIETTRVGDGIWRVMVSAGIDSGAAADVTVRFFYEGREVGREFTVENPSEWTPDTPNLHFLEVRVASDGMETDAVAVRFGFRETSISQMGLVLNGRPWRKLVGVNRHQDFAYTGMAASNSLHWRDAKKYRDAGFTIIRTAHYPQDPAFMDACDELGLFVISNTPGWQFWNAGDPKFAERVYSDIRALVRRDISRPCVLFYEPILNETDFPEEFASEARRIVQAETGGRGLCACDSWSRGAEAYDIIYWNGTIPIRFKLRESQAKFVREWGDCVDDWDAQNSPSRVAIEWGEYPMVVQAEHYLHGTGGRICLDTILSAPPDLIGGCIWHGADHARGYHPENFLGGVLTYDRRPKYSYQAFRAALSAEPFLFVANALAPYSPQPVMIYANREYTATWLGKPFRGGETHDTALVNHLNNEAYYGEGVSKADLVLRTRLDDGTESEWKWARRLAKIEIELDTAGLDVAMDGDDMVYAIATLCDADGVPRRYSSEDILFEADGCEIVGPALQRTRFGAASVLLRVNGPFRLQARTARGIGVSGELFHPA